MKTKNSELIRLKPRNIRFNFENCFFEEQVELGDFLLCQLGDISCQSEYLSGEHCQRCFEISFVLSGKGEFLTNNVAYPVCAGDVCINFKGDIHRWHSDANEPLHFFYLGVELKQDCDTELLDMMKVFRSASGPIARDTYGLYDSFTGAFREIMQKASYQELVLKNYVEQIFVLSCRDFQMQRPRCYCAASPQHTEQDITCKIIRYIDSNILDTKSMTQIGEYLGYSYSYLSHVFSQVMHCSIKNYFDRQKFKKSLEFLNDGLSVKETSDLLQYTSVQSFSKAFKNHFGVSPENFSEISNDSQEEDIKYWRDPRGKKL
ncbi:MAG: AraC family transcriptional regulator [Oscillospiraceae bacterium]